MPVLNIRTKLFLGFSVLLAMMAGGNVYDLVHHAELVNHTSEIYGRSIKVNMAILRAKADVIAISRSLRDVLLSKTGEEIDRHIQVMDQLETQARASLDMAGENIDDESQRKLLEEINRHFQEFGADRRQAVAMLDKNGHEKTAEVALSISAAHVNSIGELVDLLWQNAETRTQAKIAATRDSARRDGVLMGMVFTAALLASVALAMFLAHHIGGRLRQINLATMEVSVGRFGRTVNVKGSDEIAQLADTFNLMSHSLAALHDSLNREIAATREEKEGRLRLEAAIEQAGEAVVITDAGGTILYVNPAFESASGYSKAEAAGKNPRILKSGVHGPEFYKAMWDTIKSGGVWSGVICNRKKDGTLYYDQATISPIKNEEGRIVNYVAVKRNITGQISTEKELAQLREKEISLQRENEELEKALKEQQAMSGWEQGSVTASMAGVGPLWQRFPEKYEALKAEYGNLLDEYLDALGFNRPPNRHKIGALAESVGGLGGGPKDVVDMHIRVVSEKSKEAHPKRARAYTVEGRLLALEVMGNLVDFYRRGIFIPERKKKEN